MVFEYLYEIFSSILSFVIVLGIAVIIHEYGHFIVARLSGVRVEKFSVGFGRKLFGFKWGDTEYIVAPIPMGGYVKMAGENPAEVTGKKDEFYSGSPWRRIPILIAGPGANIIGAFLIFFGLAYLYGQTFNYNVVGKVIPGSLEAQAGFEKGDRILSVDGQPVETWEDYTRLLDEAMDGEKNEMQVEVARGEEKHSLTMPISKEATDGVLVLSYVDLVGPAFQAGIQVGDRITSIDGKNPETWTAFREQVISKWKETANGIEPETISLGWQTPAGEVKSASVTPAIIRDRGETVAVIGISPASPGAGRMGIAPRVPPKVQGTTRGFPARKMGIEKGAEIIAINGEIVDDAEQVERAITFSYELEEGAPAEDAAPVPIELTWKNPGEERVQTTTVTPQIEYTPLPSDIGIQSGKYIPLASLGVTFAEPRAPLSLARSVSQGIDKTLDACAQTWFVLRGLVTQEVNRKLVGGPVAILQLSARVGKDGFRRLLEFCALLQANLALLNLLPIPVLDGGHLVVALAEGTSRRTFSLRTRERIQMLGIFILAPLFLFVFYNDFDRIGLFDWIKELFT